jgi:hypothetical protein
MIDEQRVRHVVIDVFLMLDKMQAYLGSVVAMTPDVEEGTEEQVVEETEERLSSTNTDRFYWPRKKPSKPHIWHDSEHESDNYSVSRDSWCEYSGCGCAYCMHIKKDEDLEHWQYYICELLAGAGKLLLLKTCKANGYPWNVWACNAAIANNQMRVLRYLLKHGCEPPSCLTAVECDNLEALIYLHEVMKFPLDLRCTGQARSMKMLEYLHKMKCPWDGRSYREQKRNPQIIEFMTKHKCPEVWVGNFDCTCV